MESTPSLFVQLEEWSYNFALDELEEESKKVLYNIVVEDLEQTTRLAPFKALYEDFVPRLFKNGKLHPDPLTIETATCAIIDGRQFEHRIKFHQEY